MPKQKESYSEKIHGAVLNTLESFKFPSMNENIAQDMLAAAFSMDIPSSNEKKSTNKRSIDYYENILSADNVSTAIARIQEKNIHKKKRTKC